MCVCVCVCIEPEQDFKMALNIFLDTVKGKGVSQDLVKEAL